MSRGPVSLSTNGAQEVTYLRDQSKHFREMPHYGEYEICGPEGFFIAIVDREQFCRKTQRPADIH